MKRLILFLLITLLTLILPLLLKKSQTNKKADQTVGFLFVN